MQLHNDVVANGEVEVHGEVTLKALHITMNGFFGKEKTKKCSKKDMFKIIRVFLQSKKCIYIHVCIYVVYICVYILHPTSGTMLGGVCFRECVWRKKIWLLSGSLHRVSLQLELSVHFGLY